MAGKQKHSLAGNPYNLWEKVEILVKFQLEDKDAFLNEFSSELTQEDRGSTKSGADQPTDSILTGYN